MRFRLRSLLVVVTGCCLALGLWISWPQHTARRFERLLRAGELDRIQSMLAAGDVAGPPITMTIDAGYDFTIEPRGSTLSDYALGRRRYTLKTPYGWCEFTAQQGRLVELRDRYFYGGVEFVTVF
ncbi:hypothetical protein [Aeoliella sp.]|uniref:hypothetical protein n=1 Tax=Aeoliella sp. TaxID=2795800 RepID=UPI003CCC45FF